MKILKNYTDQKNPINPLDKRLIKGFYTTYHWELENDQIADEFDPEMTTSKPPNFTDHFLK